IQTARKLNLQPISEINPNRHLFYVYVLQTDNRSDAFKEAARIRKATPFLDTWVYSGKLGQESELQVVMKPETKQEQPVVSVETSPETKPMVETPAETTSTTATEVVTEKPQGPVADLADGSKNFYFKIEDAIDHKQLTGDIDLIEVARARRLASYSGN